MFRSPAKIYGHDYADSIILLKLTVTRQFVAGRCIAYITGRNIIEKEREREKLTKRQFSYRDEDNFIEKNAKRKKENTEKERKVILFT